MTTGVTPQGFTVDSISTILARLQTKLQAIFGPNIDLDPDSIDGQTIGIFAAEINSLGLLAQDTYNNPNPDSSTGASLARLVKLNGILKSAGKYTFNVAQIGGQVNSNIAAGSSVIAEGSNNNYVTLAAVTIPDSGVVTVGVQSSEFASWDDTGAARIGTPTYGWQSVSLIGPNNPGQLEETDQQLRIRRAQSVATPSQAIVDGLQDALQPTTMPGVTTSRVYENFTGSPDPVTGQAPHSIYAIVAGTPDPQAVGQVLWVRRSLGCTQLGNTVVAIADSRGYTHNMTYQVPVTVPIFLTLHYTALPGFPATGVADLTTALVNWANANFTIGGEVVWSQLFEPINTIVGVSVTSLFIGTAPAPVGTGNITPPYDELPVLIAANMQILTP